MKKLLLTITALTSIFTASAQCPQEPSCSYSFLSANGINNQTFNQSVCIYGKGDIASSVNWNSWGYLKFEASSGDMNVYQNVNFSPISKDVWTITDENYILNFYGNVNFVGGSTFTINEGSTVNINSITVNNVSPPLPNTIILKIGASLTIAGVAHYAGETIHTVPGNAAGDLYIWDCISGSPLALVIKDFKIEKDQLTWDVESEDIITIEYSSDSKIWKEFYSTFLEKGSTPTKETGFYRLKSGNSYSKILSYNKEKLNEGNIIYYDIERREFTYIKPTGKMYGVKHLK